MSYAYKNTNGNSGNRRKILIVFDDMVCDMIINKKKLIQQ